MEYVNRDNKFLIGPKSQQLSHNSQLLQLPDTKYKLYIIMESNWLPASSTWCLTIHLVVDSGFQKNKINHVWKENNSTYYLPKEPNLRIPEKGLYFILFFSRIITIVVKIVVQFFKNIFYLLLDKYYTYTILYLFLYK